MVVIASIVTPVLEVLGVWLACIGLHGGAASAAALIAGRSGADIGAEAARGGAAGFLIGVPLATGTAILLAIT